MLYNSVSIKHTIRISMFYMRFLNETGSTVTVSGLNNLLSNPTGTPVLQTAVVERNGSTDDVKGSGNSINNFTVANNESCVFRMTWAGGVFNLQGTTTNSYKNIVRSAGYEIKGNYNVPNNFMSNLFYSCVNYNQQVGDIFDTSEWYSTNIGISFLYYTWYGCTSLTTAVVPDTSNWNVTSIGTYFLGYTWYGCSSLTTAVAIDTSNWNVTTIGIYFLGYTWYGCSSLTTAVILNTSNWNVTSIGNYFLNNTWGSCSLLTTAVVPDTSNWNITSIGNYFLGYTWYGCTLLTTAVSPDTSNWNVTSIGYNFLDSTWYNCTSLTTAVVPDTSKWNVTSIEDYFLGCTWRYCTSLTTAVVPDTSKWNVTSIEDYFLYSTWGNAFATATGSTNNVILKGSIYTGNITALQSNSGGIDNARIGNVKVDSNLISAYQNSADWSNITDSKFITW
jgi:hypothetical protein